MQQQHYRFASAARSGSAPAQRVSPAWDEESWHYTMTPPKSEEAPPPAAARDHRDLCSICMYAAECIHPGTIDRPKVYCELFDVDVETLVAEQKVAKADVEARDLAGGLCCNCENRERCTIHKPEGTVWHCEEYC
ncbi:MAG: hypothetical protein ABFC96_09395 [Thermoguttaceae bacterium]